LGRGILRGNDTEYTVLILSAWKGEYREDLILSITVIVVGLWGI
jgi:hypothetical protein